MFSGAGEHSAALTRGDVVFRMRHHAENEAGGIADAGDGVDRSVGIGGIFVTSVTERDAVLRAQLFKGFRGAGVTSFTVGHRAMDGFLESARPHTMSRDGLQRDPAAFEVSAFIVPQSAGEQAGAHQHLETVAHAEHRHTAGDQPG